MKRLAVTALAFVAVEAAGAQAQMKPFSDDMSELSAQMTALLAESEHGFQPGPARLGPDPMASMTSMSAPEPVALLDVSPDASMDLGAEMASMMAPAPRPSLLDVGHFAATGVDPKAAAEIEAEISKQSQSKFSMPAMPAFSAKPIAPLAHVLPSSAKPNTALLSIEEKNNAIKEQLRELESGRHSLQSFHITHVSPVNPVSSVAPMLISSRTRIIDDQLRAQDSVIKSAELDGRVSLSSLQHSQSLGAPNDVEPVLDSDAKKLLDEIADAEEEAREAEQVAQKVEFDSGVARAPQARLRAR